MLRINAEWLDPTTTQDLDCTYAECIMLAANQFYRPGLTLPLFFVCSISRTDEMVPIAPTNFFLFFNPGKTTSDKVDQTCDVHPEQWSQ